MKNSYSSNLVLKPSKILSKAAKKQLEYFNPKGASKRKLGLDYQTTFFELALIYSKIHSENVSSQKTPLKSLRSLKVHSDLVKSTKVLENLTLVSSRHPSPSKLNPVASDHRDLTPQYSVPRLEVISDIVDSCEKVSKLNKSDIVIINDLAKENLGVHKKAKDFIDQRTNFKIKGEINKKLFCNKPKKDSIDKIKQETFETSYFVERKLRKNTVKKLREKIMPWKKVDLAK